jgi:hypothetical protein
MERQNGEQRNGEVRDMQKLATGKNERGDAQIAAGDLQDAAAIRVHAAAFGVQAVRRCIGEGDCGQADVAG